MPRRPIAIRAAGVVLLAVTLAGCAPRGRTQPTGASAATATTTAARASTSVSTSLETSTAASSASRSSPVAPETAEQRRARVDAAVARIGAGQPAGAISVAAINTATGRSYAAGAESGMRMASVYKLLLVEALLLRGGSLSDAEAATATAAIEHSDNVAGFSLFISVGRKPGMDAAVRRLEMPHTVPAANDPTFTTTSATDALQMLRALVRSGGPFGKQTQSFVLGLMSEVEDDQRWGVGAVADEGTTFYNKNGWLSIDDANPPGERDDGRWAVTSVGIVTVHGDQVLMAVLTQHQPSFDRGIDLVERLARTIVPAVAAR